jgi:hypothetical protein
MAQPLTRGDDRLGPLVRICFTPLAIFTAIFGPLLLLFPSSTEDYWAWAIRPAMSAIWVGAGYTFGAIAITTMLIAGRWRSSIVPIIATWPFAVVMLAATLIHNDRFFTDKVGYFIWLAIYVILPWALPAMYILNRSRDPGPSPEDLLLPQPLRFVLAGAGIIVGPVGILMVLAPSVLDQSWPWLLTPLMSRVIGGWLLFLATGALLPLLETRYEAYRNYFPATALWFAALFVSAVLQLGDFDFGKVSAALFFAAMAVTVFGSIAIWVHMERLRARRRQERGSHTSV